MKTFQNKILNSVLGWVAISALVSGCDLTSLRSSLSKDSSRSSSSSGSSGSSGTSTTPTLPSYGGSGDGSGSGYGSGGKKGSGKKSDGGYGSGISSDFGGYPSKKQSQQKTSWSDSYPSDYPSQNSSGHHSGSWGDNPWGDDDGYPSYPGNSSGHSHGGHGPGGYDQGGFDSGPYARTNERTRDRSNGRNTHAAAATATASTSVPASQVDSETSSSSASRTTHRTIGESCSGSHHGICLALKYVSYVDGYGDDVESERDAIRDVEYANQIWRECGIQFQLEDYQNVQPQNYDLRYRTRNYEELNQIRGTFSDENKLLVVATGKWDRSGSLGSTWANAWTNLPGERFYGVVLERTVTSYPQILAHELGHYLSLDHKNDINSLMNPVVARQSVELSRQECRAARWAVKSYWREMMR